MKRLIAESVRKWEARPRYSELTPEVLAVGVFRAQGKADLTGLDPRQQLEAFSASAQASELDPLDSRWYDLGDLAAARVRFIREAPALFAARLPE